MLGRKGGCFGVASIFDHLWQVGGKELTLTTIGEPSSGELRRLVVREAGGGGMVTFETNGGFNECLYDGF